MPDQSFTHLFATGYATNVIDFVRPGTNPPRTYVTNETLEQVQRRHPTAQLYEWDSWIAEKERQLTADPPVEITEDKFIEALECLPPQNWQRQRGAESFELCEHTSGRVTCVYVRVGQRFFAHSAIAGTLLEAHTARVRFTFPDFPHLNPEIQNAKI